ncbi:hypothetical protein QFZ33_002268 [Arthrobacter globiformis]|nr:hypothetical protein [Arthrobacter globiformis]
MSVALLRSGSLNELSSARCCKGLSRTGSGRRKRTSPSWGRRLPPTHSARVLFRRDYPSPVYCPLRASLRGPERRQWGLCPAGTRWALRPSDALCGAGSGHTLSACPAHEMFEGGRSAMSSTDPQPLACPGQKCPLKAVCRGQAEPGYVLTPGVTTARGGEGFPTAPRGAALRWVGGAKPSKKRVWTVSTPWASDSVVLVPDWAGLGMFLGEWRIFRGSGWFESHLGHSVFAGQAPFAFLLLTKLDFSAASMLDNPRVSRLSCCEPAPKHALNQPGAAGALGEYLLPQRLCSSCSDAVGAREPLVSSGRTVMRMPP